MHEPVRKSGIPGYYFKYYAYLVKKLKKGFKNTEKLSIIRKNIEKKHRGRKLGQSKQGC